MTAADGWVPQVLPSHLGFLAVGVASTIRLERICDWMVGMSLRNFRTSFALEIPLAEYRVVMLDVPRDNISHRSNTNPVVAGDSAPRPSLLRHIPKK